MTSATRSDRAAPAAEEGRVQLQLGDDGIALLRLGAASESMLTLTAERLESLDAAISQLRSQNGLRGVIVTGPTTGMFAAGADIKMFETLSSVEEAVRGAARGQALFGRFGELSVPVVGAIEGPCLGGGLEMALGFDVRIASDHPATSIGLPEVKLGILPGFGGTQRLTRLIGLPAALDMILAGKLLRAVPALRRGVVDRVVPSERLLEAARQEVEKLFARNAKAPRRRLRGLARAAQLLPPVRSLIASQARKQLDRPQARHYEAPKRALECCLDALRLPVARGFDAEARALGELIVGEQSRNLVHLFFLTERAKKLGKDSRARAVQRAVVVGGGAMGAGIAGLMASRGIAARLCDLDGGVLAAAKARLAKAVGKRVARKRLKKHEAQAQLDRLAVSTEWGNLTRTDLFLEAVTENLTLKRRLFEQAAARGLPRDAIIATNTSSLSVDAMAEDLPHPERVVGLHFFNPPEKMPLVEVVRGAHTSEEAVASGCRLATALGKFPIVVRDAPGFLVNRCLSPYLNEAARMMIEGTAPEDLDRALVNFGMPMGPARLMDEVGFDVLAHVAAEASTAEAGTDSSPRAVGSPLFRAIADSGHLGQKTGGALYDKSGNQPGPARSVLDRLRREAGAAPRATPGAEILHRLLYPMIDEAFRCLDDGIVESEADLDLGMVMGTGFAPFRGGIARYARKLGFAHLTQTLEQMTATHGERFAPGEGLRRRATET